MNIIKKISMIMVILSLLFFHAKAIEITAQTAVLIEEATGEIIFSKEHMKKMKPASTTKILTAITALLNSSLSDEVSVSVNAANTEGSSMYIEPGEKITMHNLLYGLMMNSGNDAAVAIAEHISGSTEKFAHLMNKTAKLYGAENSNFINPNGLDDDNHYTTAYDLALITSGALKNPVFAEIVKTKSKVVETVDGVKKYLKNHNRLLFEFSGCDGVKTGFTKASGRTLVSSATRDGMQLIAVTMNAPDDWNDHKKMLNYGFSEYELYTILNHERECCKNYVKYGTKSYVSLKPQKSVTYTVKKNDSDLYSVEYVLNETEAPVKVGETEGYAVVKCDGKEIERIKLLACEDVEKVVVKKDFSEILSMFFQLFLSNKLL